MKHTLEDGPLRIGVDLGGTKIEAAAVAPDGDVALRRRAPTPRDDYDATLDAIVRLVADVERDLGYQTSVGVGMPGAISPATGVVKNANSTWLNGRALDCDLTARLGRPLRFANDANCFALSEARGGAAAGARVVFGVIIGTGTGGGVVVDGKVLTGPNAVAGEWGHNGLPRPAADEVPGPSCYCGLRGCIETFLSGPGLARDHALHTGQTILPADIVTLADEGDAGARASLERYEDRMARSLASIINVLDPDVIVLGGGMSKVSRLYANVPRLWSAYVFSDRVDTRLAPPRFGDSSGVRGAAWLWAEE
ncbi:MAG: ROK family protein [Bacteroidales bacterium]